ncbi:MAG: hydroxymethylglutaryl-CoA lyase [Bacteroidota bacterium]|nr:hydroxymethylglutaryl-CoA lyase [Bacteroidota bacterium]
MQGISKFIPTDIKVAYINQLLKVGFNTIDFGSFVSPKAIPQLKDTAEVLTQLDFTNSSSKLLAIVANQKGAIDACNFEEINYLGFPLSVSEQFQQRNTNKSIDEALSVISDVQNLSLKHNKTLVVYLSMAFGNPYREIYHPDIVAQLTKKLYKMEVGVVALSDTIGVAACENIQQLFSTVISEYPTIEFGAHFHTTINSWKEKIDSAYQNGCRRFDAALKGYGGCPMAKEKLVGNMPTEKLVSYFREDLNLNLLEFEKSLEFTKQIFKKL